MHRLLANFEAWIPMFPLFPGGRLHDVAGVSAWTCDVQLPFFNGIYGIPGPEADEVLGLFEGRPVLWVVPPPGGGEDDLAARGFALQSMPGMCLDLERLPELVVPDGVEVHQVDDDPALLEVATTIAFTTNGFPEFAVPPLLEMLSRMPGRSSFRTFLATVDGEPAAASALLVTDGTAGLYDVGTLPAFRRRGLGRLVSLAALHAGRADGCDLGVLESSPDGEPVYRALGFEEVCRLVFALRA